MAQTTLKKELTGRRSLRQTMAHGIRALGGANVPNYTLLYLDDSKNKKKGNFQTIVVPYVEVGRGGSCVIQYSDVYPTIHRKHAAILWDKGKVTLKHLGKNPLLVNNYAVNGQQMLQNGDEIQFSNNGPRIRFNIAETKIGEAKFTDRLVMFTQQALKPYKRGVAVLGLLVFSVLGFGINQRIQFNNLSKENSLLIKNQTTELREKEEKIQKIIADRVDKKNDLATLANSNQRKESKVTKLKNELSALEYKIQKVKEEQSKVVIPPSSSGYKPQKISSDKDIEISNQNNSTEIESNSGNTSNSEVGNTIVEENSSRSSENNSSTNQDYVEEETKPDFNPEELIGKTVTYTDVLKYKVNSGSWIDMLVDIPVSYTVQYTAVIEQVLGENFKLIVSGANIRDPNWASMNYIEYKSYAIRDAQNQIGRNVVMHYSEVE